MSLLIRIIFSILCKKTKEGTQAIEFNLLKFSEFCSISSKIIWSEDMNAVIKCYEEWASITVEKVNVEI